MWSALISQQTKGLGCTYIYRAEDLCMNLGFRLYILYDKVYRVEDTNIKIHLHMYVSRGSRNYRVKGFRVYT